MENPTQRKNWSDPHLKGGSNPAGLMAIPCPPPRNSRGGHRNNPRAHDRASPTPWPEGHVAWGLDEDPPPGCGYLGERHPTRERGRERRVGLCKCSFRGGAWGGRWSASGSDRRLGRRRGRGGQRGRGERRVDRVHLGLTEEVARGAPEGRGGAPGRSRRTRAVEEVERREGVRGGDGGGGGHAVRCVRRRRRRPPFGRRGSGREGSSVHGWGPRRRR